MFSSPHPFLWLVAALFLAFPAHRAEAVSQTRDFQQGLDAYAGVADTWISTEDWGDPPQYTVHHGTDSTLELQRDGRGNPLIRFDLSAIPPNSRVVSASLNLYNTTPSTPDGTGAFARRANLYRVLKPWAEDGATGDAADTGEPWGNRGMAAEVDYEPAPASFADIVNAGWYDWEVTNLVRGWVRGEIPNHGLVLRDATGYEAGQQDGRAFCSSQWDEAEKRPKLTVVYNPDVPLADAGADREILQWDGTAVMLDGSGSRDRPGGDDQALSYEWRILTPAFGSAMENDVLQGEIVSFTPDVPGEWEMALTVTNKQGESAVDTVRLRLLRIPVGHPRIYLTPDILAGLKARATGDNFRWNQLKENAEADNDNMHADALVYQVTGDKTHGRQAVAEALVRIGEPDYPTRAGEIAVIYDWCYEVLTLDEKTRFLDFFRTWAQDLPKSEDVPGWGNYWPRYGYSYAHIGLAAYGDAPEAEDWLEEFRHRRYGDYDIAILNHIKDGGAWPEGSIYDGIANLPRIKAVEAWLTATGENLYASSPWYQNRMGYLLLGRLPGLAAKQDWEVDYHGYPSIGDAERNRGSLKNYDRIMGLLLASRFPDAPHARELMAALSAPPVNNSADFCHHEEFLWFDPDLSTRPPSLTTHFAPDTGTLYVRSDWPDGAADTDPGATHITFQCGDHFTYHQHYDQNSFTLFKHGDLAVESGVYSGDGLSYHDVNYYVRTIAHNTLVVYQPDEDFSSARPDATSNDGGQRTFYPASRSPESVAYFQQHQKRYDTGDMRRYEAAPLYVYALGDAARAYNSEAYNQAGDPAAFLPQNTAKVRRFLREFVYLRKTPGDDGDFLVLLDRVGVTREAFSGPNTKLLFHTLNEPVVQGASTPVSPGETLYAGAVAAHAAAGEGKLFFKFLSPVNVRKVGGRGEKAFWVFGENIDWHWDKSEPQPRPTNDFELEPYGEWRLELEPMDTGLDHQFLTVLQPAAVTLENMRDCRRLDGEGVAGVWIAGPVMNRAVLFSADMEGTPPQGLIRYTALSTLPTFHLVVDLEPGRAYRLETQALDGRTFVTLTPDAAGMLTATDQGVLSFIAPVLPGDVNGDGTCDLKDAVLALKTTVSLETAVQLDADVNRDGRIGLAEAAYVLEGIWWGFETGTK